MNERNDVRVWLANTFANTQELIRRENEIKLETVELIGLLHDNNAAGNLDMFHDDYIDALGLTKDQYYKRLNAYRALREAPQLKSMWQQGKTHLSHLALVGRKITPANADVIVGKLAGKSKREVEAFLARVDAAGNVSNDPDREVVEVRLRLSQADFDKLSRARDVLSAAGRVPDESEAVVKALEDLLFKRDPLQKAERAATRKEARKSELPRGESKNIQKVAPSAELSRDNSDQYNRRGSGRTGRGRRTDAYSRFAPGQIAKRQRIANQTRHLVWLRDRGQCTHEVAGERCRERRMLEVDHIVPVCRGGTNAFENLRLLCRFHNRKAAEDLGIPIRKRNLQSVTE